MYVIIARKRRTHFVDSCMNGHITHMNMYVYVHVTSANQKQEIQVMEVVYRNGRSYMYIILSHSNAAAYIIHLNKYTRTYTKYMYILYYIQLELPVVVSVCQCYGSFSSIGPFDQYPTSRR